METVKEIFAGHILRLLLCIWIDIVTCLLTADNLGLFFISLRHHRFNTVTLGEMRILSYSCDLFRSFFWSEMSISQF